VPLFQREGPRKDKHPGLKDVIRDVDKGKKFLGEKRCKRLVRTEEGDVRKERTKKKIVLHGIQKNKQFVGKKNRQN